MEMDKANKLLVRAVCDILCQACGGRKYMLVHMSEQEPTLSNNVTLEASAPTLTNREEISKQRLDHRFFHSQLR